MSYWCQACDVEMRLEASIVYVDEYITCGKPKCARWAKKMFAMPDPVKKVVRKVETPVLIVVYATETPDIQDSWKAIAEDEHPDFLSDPEVLTKMLDEGLQAKESNDDEDGAVWYQVERLTNALGRAKKERLH